MTSEPWWIYFLFTAAALGIALLVMVLNLGMSLRGRVKRIGEEMEVLAQRSVPPSAADPGSAEVMVLLAELKTGIGGLSDRIGQVATRVDELADREPEPVASPRVAGEMEPLLREAVETVLARIQAVEEALARPREEDLSETVERVLGHRGFTDVRVIDGPEGGGGRTRLRVEARRDGMIYKGPVFLDGTRVVEQRLSPSYPMFP